MTFTLDDINITEEKGGRMATTKSKHKRKRFLIRLMWKRRREVKKAQMKKGASGGKVSKKQG